MTYKPKLVIATGNRKKGVEMAALLAETGLEILTLADFPGVPCDVDETGSTYMENAILKAQSATKATGLVCIADDAGLEIDALGGEPGIYSRRFLGEDTPFDEKMLKILAMLHDIPDIERGCRFSCAVAICTPDGITVECTGVCEGVVAKQMKGSYGFGYDPIFYLPDMGFHMSELPPAEKHRISHRGKALACARKELGKLFTQ